MWTVHETLHFTSCRHSIDDVPHCSRNLASGTMTMPDAVAALRDRRLTQPALPPAHPALPCQMPI